ncbi:MAG: glutamine amidotransferase [Sphingobium sp.]|jgi:GMP synthase (glutamine-hydrolysing)|nr:glutamine amidotransferase [Sphingobium sp.]MCP5398344.1 glutamine amidotransferase [Sphingomonas sp.]
MQLSAAAVRQVDTTKSALIIRHLHFEDLGTFAQPLNAANFEIRYLDVGTHDLAGIDPLEPDLLIVLGGPVGVYETEAYPFLAQERRLLEARLAKNLPTLGICLGGQQIAVSLGASVVPTGSKEIGFSKLALTAAGLASPLRHLQGIPVLHWHGDAFSIPEGASHLAATRQCMAQAFSLGPNILALQFHPEFDIASGIENWLIGHACELAETGLNPADLRRDADAAGGNLREASRLMLAQWLSELAL